MFEMSDPETWFDVSVPAWEQDYGCCKMGLMVARFRAILDSQHTGLCTILYREPNGQEMRYFADFSLRKEIVFEPHRSPDGVPVFVLSTCTSVRGGQIPLRFMVSSIIKIESCPQLGE